MKKILFTLTTFCLIFQAKAQDKNYTEEEVSYWNTVDSVKIGGTLSIPKSGSKFPVVLFITGSGQQDRDETILIHKPFKVIAEYLAEKGIASLRVDDRGIGKTTGNMAKSTGKDFVKDILSGVEYLKSRKEFDSKKIGLIGHSEGGCLAPEVAVKSGNVAFIVSLAGGGVDGLSLLKKQNFEVYKAAKVDTNVIRKYLDTFFEPSVHDILEEKDKKAMIAKTVSHMRRFKDEVGEKDYKNLLPVSPYDSVFAKQVVGQINNVWYRDFLIANPADYWKQVKCPVLALNGTKDLQVDADLNLTGIEQSLKIAKNQKYKIVRLPNLNHLFQYTETGRVSEYGNQTDTPTKETLEIIGNWILELIK
jgi:alpha/beta superfamily hydrolase